MATRSERVRARNARQNGRQSFFDLLWNCLSLLAVIGIVAVCGVVGLIYADPASAINPFPPPTTAPTLILPTTLPTETPVVAVVIFTPEPSATPETVEPTPMPTETLIPTETPTEGPTATATIRSAYPYIVDTTSVISGETFHSGEGCKLWVAGQTFDLNRAPYVGIKVRLGGYVTRTISQLSLTGTALQYGPAGYEFTILDEAQDSKESLWVQLLDQTDVPLSPRVYFDTFADCSKNLVLINFRKVK